MAKSKKQAPVVVVGADGASYGTFESTAAAQEALPYEWQSEEDGPIFADDQSVGQRLTIVEDGA